MGIIIQAQTIKDTFFLQLGIESQALKQEMLQK